MSRVVYAIGAVARRPWRKSVSDSKCVSDLDQTLARVAQPEMLEWVNVPREHGWYWHRFYVSGHPVFNLCCVSVGGGRVYVHYLGELDQQAFQANDIDMFWGPLTPPP